jgi:hypothetical protein
MLDFKNFVKVAEDDKTATMRHPKGHEIRVILKGLRPIEREQLKRIKMAGAGSVADAAAEQDVPTTDPAPIAAAPAAPDAVPQGAEEAPVDGPQVPATPSVLNPDGTMNPGAVAQTNQAAGGLGQKIDTETAKAQAVYERQLMNARQQVNDEEVEHAKAFRKNADETLAAMKAGVINPEQYGQSQSDQQKIATGVGLFLGGMGGGGHSNLALDFLNKQIDRNIDAQKENFEHQKNIYGAYLDLYHNENIATALTKANLNDMMVNQVKLTAARLGTPIAAQRAMQYEAAKALETSKAIQDSVVNLSGLPGQQGRAATPAGGETASLGPVSAEKKQDSILGPNSQQRIKDLAYTPKAKDQYVAIQDQYNRAAQADKGLARVNETFDQLEKDVKEGSIGGNIRRRGGHAVAGIPLGIGQALSGSLNYLTDTDANRSYEDTQSKLTGFISSALKGTNIGGDQIKEIVEKNSPERGDSPEHAARKRQNIKDFITDHTDTGLIKTWGLDK